MMQRVPSFLSRLAVSAVYWVDDENASDDELDLEKLVGAVADALTRAGDDQRKAALSTLKTWAEGKTTMRQVAVSITSEFQEGDPVAISETIERLLRDRVVPALTNTDPKALLGAMLQDLPQPLTLNEKEAVCSAFAPTEQGTWAWRPLSFRKWEDEHGQILEQHRDDAERALLVVDLQNMRESSTMGGEDVLAQWAEAIRSNGQQDRIIAVALTGQVKPEDELRASRQLTSKLFREDGPKLPVFVLSKLRLRADQDEDVGERAQEAITHVLERVRACQIHTHIAEAFESLFASSVEHAFTTLQQLSIEELLLAVSSSSFIEGAHEVDTLIRMVSVAQRKALLTNLASNSDIQESLIELRGLGTQSVRRSQLESVDGLDELRSSEFHDPGEIVNGLLSPTSSGDIFEFEKRGGAANEYYVLVASACDLVLRGSTGERKLKNAMLLPLLPGASAGSGDSFTFRVTNFPSTSVLAGREMTVDLRQCRTVSLDVLDLCWSNKDGKCLWSRESGAENDLRFLPAQKVRYQAISIWLSNANVLDLLQVSPNGVPATTRGESKNLVQVDFSVRRIGRLSSGLTFELVQEMASVVSRPSAGHDYSGRKS